MRSADTSTQPIPTVIEDVGPDGLPQALLVTPSTATVLTRAAAATLITDLLRVLEP